MCCCYFRHLTSKIQFTSIQWHFHLIIPQGAIPLWWAHEKTKKRKKAKKNTLRHPQTRNVARKIQHLAPHCGHHPHHYDKKRNLQGPWWQSWLAQCHVVLELQKPGQCHWYLPDALRGMEPSPKTGNKGSIRMSESIQIILACTLSLNNSQTHTR